MIDLHCHSYFSDGVLSPKELIEKAQAQKIKCLSLTDHDTIAGYPELLEAAAATPIKIINGIELSARWKKHELHILGYQINHTPSLLELITRQNQSRIERAQQIGTALASIDISDAYAKACELAGHNRVGRPHFAQLLVNEGKVKDLAAAFKRFLGRGKIAYVPTPWISIEEAVQGIVDAGGQAVIAHPLKYGLTRSKLHELINEFKNAGGVGLEVVSGEMTVTEVNEMAATCLRFHLLASSGSDYHSDRASRTHLGCQKPLPLNCMPIWHEWNI
ncbi:PHP domain-containing protein [Fluoribacter dumoffii]|uniref:Histidinol phosphatase and related hydrolases of the PHP family n=2 Tax=Fluoribacter dumoffii TaxID=463 RepID=A0A377GA14_9GAMM|nr:PHP domain-containing protein [Fluoribacter dumoffii]KTC89042.1 TrpH protein [Fluoribacter dumoffii NY 23]MCW8385750.1 PHP domain-containing protein [Fluoribacter dumoffii]MCW8495955.1 PHP domain-containing protein [Fluoribacter dumoffii]STO21554.1 Histidinol phosphatase and related hydrolases of the PHP family [Fluoribacter dumoffii]